MTVVDTAVFVDGCFWHRCPVHGSSPRANRDWWDKKLSLNVLRDRETNELLRRAGWEVVRGWEHETTSSVADRVVRVLQDRSTRPLTAD